MYALGVYIESILMRGCVGWVDVDVMEASIAFTCFASNDAHVTSTDWASKDFKTLTRE